MLTGDLSIYVVYALAIIAFPLLFAIWYRRAVLLWAHYSSRVVLDSFAAITYIPVAFGLSILQLYTTGFLLLTALILLSKRELRGIAVMPSIIILCVIYLVSGALQEAWRGAAEGFIRWSYLYLLSTLVVATSLQSGARSVMIAGWICLLYPLANQAKSIATNTPVFNAGQYSYIGTFSHESDLTFLILGFIILSFWLAISKDITSKLFKLMFLISTAYGHVALYLCNYRTSFVALAAFWALIAIRLWPRLRPGYKIGASFAAAVVLAGGLFSIGNDVRENLSDLSEFVAAPGEYLDFSGHAKRTHLMSGRIDLINMYMSRYISGTVLEKMFGIGPGKGNEVFGIYAHNELISGLVETGAIGLLALLFLLWSFVKMGWVRSSKLQMEWIVVHSGLLGMLVMVLGTMPFRDMRSLMMLGTMIGMSEYYRRFARGSDRTPESQDRTLRRFGVQLLR